MVYSLSGKLIAKTPTHAIVDVNGIGFAVWVSKTTERELPKIGHHVRLFCVLYSGRDSVELYGFLRDKERDIFQALTSITGVGPKAALKILSIVSLSELLSAIGAGRADLLMKAAGVGRKKAEHIVLELRDKFSEKEGQSKKALIEERNELYQALKTLGYKDKEIREALVKIPASAVKIQDQLKFALKILAR